MENLQDIASYLLLTALFIITCTILYIKTHSRNLPPGPTPLPLLGNILQLGGKDEGTLFDEYRKKYGDIFCIRFFNTPVIVFSGYGTMKEAFVKNGHLFSDRPTLPISKISFKTDAIVVESGENWKRNRKFSLKTLRNFGMGSNLLQTKIHVELEYFVKAIDHYNGQPFVIDPLINAAIANVMCSLLFGKRFPYDDTDFQQHLSRVKKLMGMKHLFFLSPMMQHIPGDPFSVKTALDLLAHIAEFYTTLINQHICEYDKNNIKDLTDAYLEDTHFEKEQESKFKVDQILSICSDLFVAGSHTVATCIRWGLVYLLREPNLQRKLYGELQDNVPSERLPSLDDKPALPFLEATVLEVLRHGNVAPFSVPHAPARECTFQGYTIPKNAILIPNIQSVLYDEEVWVDPDIFRPSRFLEEEGASRMKDYFIPFSMGPRMCLGESLAKMELFLFFSALVQRFEILPPEDEDPPTLEYKLGITRSPKPFMIRAIKRQC